MSKIKSAACLHGPYTALHLLSMELNQYSNFLIILHIINILNIKRQITSAAGLHGPYTAFAPSFFQLDFDISTLHLKISIFQYSNFH